MIQFPSKELITFTRDVLLKAGQEVISSLPYPVSAGQGCGSDPRENTGSGSDRQEKPIWIRHL